MMWRGQMAEHSTSLLPALQALPIQCPIHVKVPVSFQKDWERFRFRNCLSLAAFSPSSVHNVIKANKQCLRTTMEGTWQQSVFTRSPAFLSTELRWNHLVFTFVTSRHILKQKNCSIINPFFFLMEQEHLLILLYLSTRFTCTCHKHTNIYCPWLSGQDMQVLHQYPGLTSPMNRKKQF